MNKAKEFQQLIKEDIKHEIDSLKKGKRSPDKVAERISKRVLGMLIASKIDGFGDFFLLSEVDGEGLSDYALARKMRGLYPSKKVILARVKEQVKAAKKEIREGLSPQEKEVLGI